MGRRVAKNQDLTPESARSGEIVPDGDYAGMRYEDVTDLCIASVNEAYGNMTLEGVCMVHDYVLGEILEVARHAHGAAYASDIAAQFQATLDPYLRYKKIEAAVYHEMLELKRKAGGE